MTCFDIGSLGQKVWLINGDTERAVRYVRHYGREGPVDSEVSLANNSEY